MEIKKNPKSNLENYSKLFVQIGLVLALFLTYTAIEKKTYDRKITDLVGASMSKGIDEETIIIQKIQPPKPKKALPPPKVIEKIVKVENKKEIVETVVQDTDTDENEKVEANTIVEDASGDDEPVEDVPFSIIEEVPIFPGCKGTRKQKTDCLNKHLRKIVQRYFDTDLANDLGLSPGKKKIYVQFRIGTDGKIADIKVRAPHPALKKEAIRIVKKFPVMIPGKQRGRPVGMRYTLPITFAVE